MAIGESRVLEALKTLKDPYSGKNLLEAGAIRDLKVSGETASFKLKSVSSSCPHRREMMEEARRVVLGLDGVEKVEAEFFVDVPVQAAFRNQLPAGVRNIVAVSSAKGGVGKSTLAVNLACALAQAGDRVGLLDCDIYGPSVPTMMGVAGRKPYMEGGKLIPVQAHGVNIMSIGLVTEEQDDAVIWRGPMVSGAIMQFFRDIDWGETDYLVLDLPPGTGDAALTIAQQVPVVGAVVVSTPQEVALSDVRRGVAMFAKVNIDVLGAVENMSGFVCPSCGTRADIFSAGGVKKAAERMGVPYLGDLPILADVPTSGDSGIPMTVADPDSEWSRRLRGVAESLAAQVAFACLAEDVIMPASFTGP